MNAELIQRVLSCRDLPTVPAVALRVVEISKRSDASLKDLAKEIHLDAALSAKILRTVNSSFFGLRRRCATIDTAIVLLGLSTVKTLALGFSLVTALSTTRSTLTLDHVAYWRRSLHSGTAAKAIARAAGISSHDECFLGGLLQDIGVIALHQCLGQDYDHILHAAGGDHSRLSRVELAELEITHAEIGGLLAAKWQLPDELINPIRFHERPSAAPAEYLDMARAVALGNIIADMFGAAEPAGPLSRFRSCAEKWLGIPEDRADAIVGEVACAVADLAVLLELNVGAAPDAQAILERAQSQLLATPVVAEDDPPGQVSFNSDLTDELSGLLGRARFDQTLIALFEQAKAARAPLGIAIFEIDGLESINASHGREAGDCIIAGAASRLEASFLARSLHVYRFQGPRFAALMPGVEHVEAARAADEARRHLAAIPVELVAGTQSERSIGVTACAGVAALEFDGGGAAPDTAADLLGQASAALHAAAAAGCNNLRIYTPRPRKAA